MNTIVELFSMRGSLTKTRYWTSTDGKNFLRIHYVLKLYCVILDAAFSSIFLQRVNCYNIDASGHNDFRLASILSNKCQLILQVKTPSHSIKCLYWLHFVSALYKVHKVRKNYQVDAFKKETIGEDICFCTLQFRECSFQKSTIFNW